MNKKYQNKKITMAHGSGGKASSDLIKDIFVDTFNNDYLATMEDQARLDMPTGQLALTTDSFVVSPLFFKGGDIGKLAITGTVNDLAMSGAKPLYLTCGLILEEGLSIDILDKIIKSMQKTAIEAGVKVVCGDTKVVEKGSADKIFINTAGVGVIDKGVEIHAYKATVGDKIIVNGFIGDHGATIMQSRTELAISADIDSDCQVLNHLVQKMLSVSSNIHSLRDATRGGVATVLNEIASDSKVCISIKEDALPIRVPTRGVCEILGLDPLYLANEGTLVCVVAEQDADQVLTAMKCTKEGENACIIGEVTTGPEGIVALKTLFGGTKIIDKLIGDQLPRIC
ncbi:Hydrogenase expression/formation protein HypE [Bathymodiolus thermophilus thioautotrophic gill symbiont]|uniref:Hydrogenase expression/formation protein HypE n=1 Tax=Bathymodiolus thermophilus thioautotrophic gill symbiont TaxID=2360 RepID=A0A3G3IQB8_9GAMM|nr:hydrogenase expression/formation protein HypE [Bathymodiolus thermophilus thioautotrophic gill symbiont]AYQ57672.1 Hydrogenase expression/formation protein HypE [Bathymodiolus thermophilus thioautotrophic gill symbiont]